MKKTMGAIWELPVKYVAQPIQPNDSHIVFHFFSNFFLTYIIKNP
jgi:hypothetical protein